MDSEVALFACKYYIIKCTYISFSFFSRIRLYSIKIINIFFFIINTHFQYLDFLKAFENAEVKIFAAKMCYCLFDYLPKKSSLAFMNFPWITKRLQALSWIVKWISIGDKTWWEMASQHFFIKKSVHLGRLGFLPPFYIFLSE